MNDRARGLRLLAAGDVTAATRSGSGSPFAEVAGLLSTADAVFVNLEAPLTARTTPALEKSVTLRTDPAAAGYLRAAGIGCVNLANNHQLDYGREGLLETLAHLEGAGIAWVGAGRDAREAAREVVLTRAGVRVALLAFTTDRRCAATDGPGVAVVEEPALLGRIRGLKAGCDHVLVSLHWGIENVLHPTPAQQRLARACIEAGASAILGHHPHRVQAVEPYRGGVIYYSLGNFNFPPCSPDLAPHHDLSLLAALTLRPDGTVGHEEIPLRLDDEHRPVPLADPDASRRAHEHLEQLAAQAAAGIGALWWYGQAARPIMVGRWRAHCRRVRLYGWRHLPPLLRGMLGGIALRCAVGWLLRPLTAHRRKC